MSKPTESGIVCLHFNVTKHELPLAQFIDAARSTKEIIDNFNSEFFEGKLEYQLNIVPPQNGGFINCLKIIVSAVPPLLLSIWDKDVRAGVIEALVGQSPKDWAKNNVGESKELCSDLVGKMTSNFLQKDHESLQKIGLSTQTFRLAYSARNRIYKDCIDNEDVKGIGFDTSHNFPVNRADFPKFIIDIPILIEAQEIKENRSWKVDTVDLIVHSPNWKRDSNRKWQGSTSEKHDISFSIEDENFWHHVKVKDFSPSIIDNLQVQWAYPEQVAKLTNVRVLRVLSYNGTPISKPLNETELLAELTDFRIEQKEQVDLFTYNQGDKK